MSDFLVYCDATSETGKALGQALGIPYGKVLEQGKQYKNLIRWGSTVAIQPYPHKVWNKLANIRLAADKLTSLQSLDKVGIRVPPFTNQTMAVTFPCLGRKVHHTQGQDIVLCLQVSDINRAMKKGCTYFVKYIPTKTEYRVFIFDGKVVKVSEKIVEQEDYISDEYQPWVRNSEAGYVFLNPRRQLSTIDSDLAVQAVKTLGLDFGAVDLIVSDDNLPYVLEVNTGPALSDNSLDLFSELFKEKLNGATLEA